MANLGAKSLEIKKVAWTKYGQTGIFPTDFGQTPKKQMTFKILKINILNLLLLINFIDNQWTSSFLTLDGGDYSRLIISILV